MEWIKKNYDQFILLLISLVLVGLSVLLIKNAMGFSEVFASILGKVTPNNTVAPIPAEDVKTAEQMLTQPPTWARRDKEGGSLFVSRRFIVKDDRLIDVLEGDQAIHPPVPNAWFFAHHLDEDILSDDVLDQDPDGDGFSNFDEFKAGTEPTDKNSHPPYISKLFLMQFIKRPFRLLFAAYDGPEFQINTLDVHQPTQFLHKGDLVAGTKFKIVGFEKKEHLNQSTGEQEDVSELTLQNTETGEQVVLVLDKIVDSPDSYALFGNFWNFPATHKPAQFQVKKNQTFSFDPEKDHKYKLIDISETEAVIEDLNPGNKKIHIPKAPQDQANPIHLEAQ